MNESGEHRIRLLHDDAFGEMTFINGKKRKQEFDYGSSYLSQSARILVLSEGVKEVHITNFKGVKRNVWLRDAF